MKIKHLEWKESEIIELALGVLSFLVTGVCPELLCSYV